MTEDQIRQEMQAADEIRGMMAEKAEAREASSEQYFQWMSDQALSSPMFGRDVEALLPEHAEPEVGIEPNQVDMTPIYGTMEPAPEQDAGEGIGY